MRREPRGSAGSQAHRRHPHPRGSERDVVVGSAPELFRSRFVRGWNGRHLLGGTVTPAPQHLNVARHDLGGEALLPLLVLPLPGADAALDVHLPALGEVLAHDLRLLAPHHHAVPFRGFLLLAALVGPALGGGKAKVRDRLLPRRVAKLRVGAQVTDQDDLVHSHGRLLGLVARSVRPNGAALRAEPRMGSPSRGPCWSDQHRRGNGGAQRRTGWASGRRQAPVYRPFHASGLAEWAINILTGLRTLSGRLGPRSPKTVRERPGCGPAA